MMEFVLSPKAQHDLEGIWDYTVQRWDEYQAERYVRAIWKAIGDVAADPRRARPCDEVRSGYWKYPAGSHVLFFRVSDGRIVIVRILHQRMDAQQHL